MSSFRSERQESQKAKCLHMVHRWAVKWQKRCSVFLFVSLFFFGISFFFAYQLPDANTLQKEISYEPKQTETYRDSFSFLYKNETYLVDPVAEYELWGLVVSHNNISSFADSYHDKDSVDIKDLCVIWGKNTKNDYQDVKFWSNSWTCWWQYPSGVSFSGRDISNNHLLSEQGDVREAIADVQVGDQIHIKGMLVNYSPESRPDWKRKSSTTRDDTGNTACEVVFVEEIEVLQRGEWVWQKIHTLSFYGIFFFFFCKIFLVFLRIHKEKKCYI